MIPDFYNKELELPIKSKVVTQPYIDFLCKKFKLSHNGPHGFQHWMRVLINGRLIARVNGSDIKVIEHFALIHDVMRTGESSDRNHGARAAIFATELWGKWIDLTEAQLELLKEACKKHSLGQITHNLTIQTCWDADRLDLGRIGIRPNPKLLGTSVARKPEFINDAYFRSKQSFVSTNFIEL